MIVLAAGRKWPRFLAVPENLKPTRRCVERAPGTPLARIVGAADMASVCRVPLRRLMPAVE